MLSIISPFSASICNLIFLLTELTSFETAYINGAVLLIIFISSIKHGTFLLAGVIRYRFSGFASTGEKPEQPPYTVLSKTSVYEIRQYNQQLWAQVEYSLPKNNDFDEGGSLGFWPLYQFITGANNLKQQIPMTAPVAMQLLASSDPATQIRRMAFIMPHSIFRTVDSLPTPTNPEVKLAVIDDVKPFACITFNMVMTTAKFKRKKPHFVKQLPRMASSW